MSSNPRINLFKFLCKHPVFPQEPYLSCSLASLSSSSPRPPQLTTMHHNLSIYGSDPSSSNTTFVQADPSTFSTIVQQLTGAPDDPSTQKFRVTTTQPNRPTTTPGPKKATFKLQERRQSAKNLQIHLITTTANNSSYPDHFLQPRQRTGFLVSPVSPLDLFTPRVSPRSPCEELCARGSPREEEEEKAIADKGFHLHPSPLCTPRGADPPELLPLFPLRSWRDKLDHDNDNEIDSST